MPPTDPSPSKDSSPVEDGEFLLRRVPNRNNTYISPEVQVGAFIPNQNDTTGLSLCREGPDFGFDTAESFLARSLNEHVRQYGGVVVVQATDIRAIELDVEPEPDSEQPGHAIIRRINIRDYEDKTTKVNGKTKRQIIKALAANLVRVCVWRKRPTPVPE